METPQKGHHLIPGDGALAPDNVQHLVLAAHPDVVVQAQVPQGEIVQPALHQRRPHQLGQAGALIGAAAAGGHQDPLRLWRRRLAQLLENGQDAAGQTDLPVRQDKPLLLQVHLVPPQRRDLLHLEPQLPGEPQGRPGGGVLFRLQQLPEANSSICGAAFRRMRVETFFSVR